VYAANRLDLGKLVEDDEDEDQPDLIAISSTAQASGSSIQREAEKPTTSSSKARSSRRSAYLKDTVLDFAQDERVGGEIVAGKLSRSGHLFVTITAATLSAWQTKVKHCISKRIKANNSAYFASCNGGSIYFFPQIIWRQRKRPTSTRFGHRRSPDQSWISYNIFALNRSTLEIILPCFKR
jgi:hypothetical protein